MALCMETKLPFFSLNNARYEAISKKFRIKIVNEEMIVNHNSPEKFKS